MIVPVTYGNEAVGWRKSVSHYGGGGVALFRPHEVPQSLQVSRPKPEGDFVFMMKSGFDSICMEFPEDYAKSIAEYILNNLSTTHRQFLPPTAHDTGDGGGHAD